MTVSNLHSLVGTMWKRQPPSFRVCSFSYLRLHWGHPSSRTVTSQFNKKPTSICTYWKHLICRYVTEGCFRLSHRKEMPADDDSERGLGRPPGLAHHSFRQADAEPVPEGQAVRCSFGLLPTAFCFAAVSLHPRLIVNESMSITAGSDLGVVSLEGHSCKTQASASCTGFLLEEQ